MSNHLSRDLCKSLSRVLREVHERHDFVFIGLSSSGGEVVVFERNGTKEAFVHISATDEWQFSDNPGPIAILEEIGVVTNQSLQMVRGQMEELRTENRALRMRIEQLEQEYPHQIASEVVVQLRDRQDEMSSAPSPDSMIASTATSTATVNRVAVGDDDTDKDIDNDGDSDNDGDDAAESGDVAKMKNVGVPAPIHDPPKTARQLGKAFFAARKYLRRTSAWMETWEEPPREFEPGASEELVVAAASTALQALDTATRGHSRWGKSVEQWKLLNNARIQLAMACSEWKDRGKGRTVGTFAKTCLSLQKPQKVQAAVQFLYIAQVTPGNAWPLLQITREVLATTTGWDEAIEEYGSLVCKFGVAKSAREE